MSPERRIRITKGPKMWKVSVEGHPPLYRRTWAAAIEAALRQSWEEPLRQAGWLQQ